MKLCVCGRPKHGLGRLCPACQAAFRLETPRRRQERVRVDEPGPALSQANTSGRNCAENWKNPLFFKPKSAGLNPKHLAWVRNHKCCVTACAGVPVHAHHVRIRSGSGVGLKPGPEWTVPLCQSHHAALHTIGALTFNDRYSVDMRAIAEMMAARSPFI